MHIVSDIYGYEKIDPIPADALFFAATAIILNGLFCVLRDMAAIFFAVVTISRDRVLPEPAERGGYSCSKIIFSPPHSFFVEIQLNQYLLRDSNLLG